MAKSLGDIMRQARKKREKTLRAFAAELGISASLLSMIEQDRHIPTQELIVDAAWKLGGDADEWCGLVGKLTPAAQKSLSDLASEDPEFFRTMVNRIGGTKK